MLSFIQFIRRNLLLSEAKIDDFKDQTKSISIDHDNNALHSDPSEIIDHFHSFNPTGDVNHTRWVINQYNKGNLKQEDAPSMKDTLTQFNKYRDKLPKKKIEQYKTLSDLRDALRPHIGTAKSDVQSQIVKKGSTLVHDSDEVKLYHVHDREAAKELGKGLPWCTSNRDNKKNMFNHYNKKSNNKFYIAHLPNEQAPYRKLGIGIGVGEFQDENNKKMSHEEITKLVNKNPDLQKIPALQGAAVATTDPNNHKKYAEELIINDRPNFKHVNISKQDKNIFYRKILDDKDKSDKLRGAIFADDDVDSNTISKALEHPDSQVRRLALDHPTTTPEQVSKALDDTNSHVRIDAFDRLASDRTSGIGSLRHVLNGKYPDLKKRAFLRFGKTLNNDDINKGLDDEDEGVRVAAIRSHVKATPEHISKALTDPNEDVRKTAAKHPNATPENISKALTDSNEDVRAAAAEHPNATPEHISKAIKDKVVSVRSAAAKNPNATPENIFKALNDKSPKVRTRAMWNPNATPEHISKALDDLNSGVRREAAGHPNATPEHISKALDDPDSGVRSSAARHPNATPEHISKALDDNANHVRECAVLNPNATPEHISKALDDKEFMVQMRAINHENASTDNLIKGLISPHKSVSDRANKRLLKESFSLY